MADQNNRDNQPDNKGQTGDPGRTPGTAEGDRQTVEEDILNKEKEGKLQTPSS